ncbi:MAG: CDP-alcohol phosphatidyltransferase family protein [Deltaproteobacteria bacterium]|nr:CDP-alcohol phosphatidyltransferase family protein [Deltaproteobacteria bacterium]
MTWAAIRIGVTTELASYLSGIVAATAFLLMISTNHLFLLLGIIALHLFNLLDCVDGSIARSTHTENPYGKFLDSLIGDFFDFLFFTVVGIMAYRNTDLTYFFNNIHYLGNISLLFLGWGASLFYLFLQHIENIYYMQLKESWINLNKNNSSKTTTNILETDGHINNKSETDRNHILRLIDRNIRARESQYFLLLVAYISDQIDLFLFFFLLYYAFRATATAIVFGRRALAVKANHLSINSQKFGL